jgi:hypothetical protein
VLFASVDPASLPRQALALEAVQETYMPLVMVRYSSAPAVFGVQPNPYNMLFGSLSLLAPEMVSASVSWVRYDGIYWADIEPSPGERNWQVLEIFDENIRILNENKLTPLVTVRVTPDWAQRVPGFSCGPIREENLDEFAAFMGDLAKRYSQYPQRIDYWEIWNEPDVDHLLVAKDSPFGCWGDADLPDYGGGYFGEMLQKVYPAIKEANPQAKVVIGGLLLDCDPDNPPEGKDCISARFIDGVVKQAPNSFDVVNFHGYAYWWETDEGDWDRNHINWGHRGGVVLGQMDYVNQVLIDNHLDKPIMATETALVCYESNPLCPGAEFFDDQANYVIRLYTRSYGHGLLGTIWYTIDSPDWRWSGLMDENDQPRPAFNAYRFLASILRGADYQKDLSEGNLEGYQFERLNTHYQIYWSNFQDEVFTIQLPLGTQAVLDKFGVDVTPSGQTLEIGFDPRIIVISSQ